MYLHWIKVTKIQLKVTLNKSEDYNCFNPEILVFKRLNHVWTNAEGESIELNGEII